MINNWLKPKWDSNVCIQNIPIEYLLQNNIKLLLLDVDNTLLPRSEISLNQSVYNWLIEAKKHIKLHLISNNPSRKRIGSIARPLQISFTYLAGKPRRGKALEAINKFNYKRSNIAIIGDRLFTDIYVGNRLGLYTILVKPINSDGTTDQKNYFQKIEKALSKVLGANTK
tara:strand:- start:1138 stop:1647 length:510 start_codon:yes stop_codon:yes gene_type:complete